MSPSYDKASVHWYRPTKNNLLNASSDGTNQFYLIGSPTVTLCFLAAQQKKEDPSSASSSDVNPLSMFAGVTDSVLPHILSFTEHAVFPCHCCRDAPIVYCRNKGPSFRFIRRNDETKNFDPQRLYEDGVSVPDRFFLNKEEPVLLYDEFISVGTAERYTTCSLLPTVRRWRGGPSARCSGFSYYVCTERGLYCSAFQQSPFCKWQDIHRSLGVEQIFKSGSGTVSFDCQAGYRDRDTSSIDCFFTKHTVCTEKAEVLVHLLQSKITMGNSKGDDKDEAAISNPTSENSKILFKRGERRLPPPRDLLKRKYKQMIKLGLL